MESVERVGKAFIPPFQHPHEPLPPQPNIPNTSDSEPAIPVSYSNPSGTARTVTSECLNVLSPVRMILKRDLQFGSGQAISASVDIQSFGWVARCLAASSGRTAPSE